MYQPNFCAECGAQVVRARWRIWTSRRFCTDCSRRLRRWSQLALPLMAAIALFGFGLIIGRTARPPAPPLTIERKGLTTSTAQNNLDGQASTRTDAGDRQKSEESYGADGTSTERPTDPNEVVSICGARTKKGTPCSRRVRGTGRCWQHRGMPAMLPPAKLIVQE